MMEGIFINKFINTLNLSTIKGLKVDIQSKILITQRN